MLRTGDRVVVVKSRFNKYQGAHGTVLRLRSGNLAEVALDMGETRTWFTYRFALLDETPFAAALRSYITKNLAQAPEPW